MRHKSYELPRIKRVSVDFGKQDSTLPEPNQENCEIWHAQFIIFATLERLNLSFQQTATTEMDGTSLMPIYFSRFRSLPSPTYNCQVNARKSYKFQGVRGNANFGGTFIVRRVSNVSLLLERKRWTTSSYVLRSLSERTCKLDRLQMKTKASPSLYLKVR